jgi:hypothetical protein
VFSNYFFAFNANGIKKIKVHNKNMIDFHKYIISRVGHGTSREKANPSNFQNLKEGSKTHGI